MMRVPRFFSTTPNDMAIDLGTMIVDIGGDKMGDAIASSIRRNHNLAIGAGPALEDQAYSGVMIGN